MSRTTPVPNTRELAERIVSHEGAQNTPSRNGIPPLFRAIQKLGGPLTTLSGMEGFRLLLARALTLAKFEAPQLLKIQITNEGSLVGLDELGTEQQAKEAEVVLTAQLLGLLVAFIGEQLMHAIVLDAWPDLQRPGE